MLFNQPQKRKKEFWEPEDAQSYFAGGGAPQPSPTSEIPDPYQAPDLDVTALQAQMIAPARREYLREVPRIEARLAKRKMGRSGDYMRKEYDALYNYLLGIGGPSADIALRAEELKQSGVQFEQQLELGWAQQGLSEQEIADKKEMFYAEQQRYSEQFDRQYSLEETEAAWRHEEELQRQGLTQQQIDNEMARFDQELQFKETELSQQDRQFEQQLELQWKQQGLNEREIADKKEMFYAEQGRLSTQFNREYSLAETEAARRHQEELSRQNLTQQQIDNAMDQFDQQLLFEMDKFGRTLTQEDRQFEKQLELQWAEQGLTQQQIDNEKEMFYDQLSQYQDQFDRELDFKDVDALRQHEEELGRQGLTQQQIDNEMAQFNQQLLFEMDQVAEMTRQWGHEFTFKQTVEMTRHEEELGRQGLTQQEIDNEMEKFDQELEWQKEHYGMVLTEQQRQFDDEMADAVRQTDLSFDQLQETIRQFDDNMKRLKELDAFEMDARERGMDLEEWQAHKAAELKEIELDYYSMEVFGYWDEGFGPEGFEGERYEWDEENEVWKVTPEWDKYMLDYYHPGELDLREEGLRIQGMLGMTGVVPGEGEPGTPGTPGGPGPYVEPQAPTPNIPSSWELSNVYQADPNMESQIIEMREAGYSDEEIAEILGLPLPEGGA